MKKLRNIIKDIVREQIKLAVKNNKEVNMEYLRLITYKQMIITEDGVGRH